MAHGKGRMIEMRPGKNGAFDMLIEMEDGSRWWLEGAYPVGLSMKYVVDEGDR